jgi:hypothetical protein
MSSSTPISVRISAEFRRRLASEAKRRQAKLSTMLRVLADERLQELAELEQLTAAEEWQRAQAWASWEAHQGGRNPEAPWRAVADVFAAARKPRE